MGVPEDQGLSAGCGTRFVDGEGVWHYCYNDPGHPEGEHMTEAQWRAQKSGDQ